MTEQRYVDPTEIAVAGTEELLNEPDRLAGAARTKGTSRLAVRLAAARPRRRHHRHLVLHHLRRARRAAAVPAAAAPRGRRRAASSTETRQCDATIASIWEALRAHAPRSPLIGLAHLDRARHDDRRPDEPAPSVERAIFPYMVMLQAIPILAIVPLIGFWFGYGTNAAGHRVRDHLAVPDHREHAVRAAVGRPGHARPVHAAARQPDRPACAS